jgi:signal transduction histidine kinase/ActR/RegA family two-component response regulator
MGGERREEDVLRPVAMQNAQSARALKQQAEDELVRANNDLERRTEELAHEKRILELLNQTAATISSRLDLRSVVQAVTEAGTQLTGARFGAFFYNVVDERGEAFLLFTLSGAPREAFEHLGLPRNTPVFARTFRGEGVVRSDDITKDPAYGQWGPHHGQPKGHLPVRSYLAVPVMSRSGEVVGGLFFGHPEIGVFTERTERLMTAVAAQAAIAFDNARLYEDVKRLAEERETLLDAERAARVESQRVSLLKDEFLANVSHELRTPLNAILGWAQVLATGDASADEVRQGLETIARNARAQTQLIDDLLDMSRIISGKVRLDVQETDLTAVVQQALNTVQPSAQAKGVRLSLVIDPTVGQVTGDPNRLQQVASNLLSNAVKFTPRGGSVDVGIQRVDSQVELTISDSGVGIKPEFLPHVFERFRQGDSSPTRVHTGLGLGLSIVKHLVELHGGSVRVHSEGDNHGATFAVQLPLAPIRGPQRDARFAPPTPPFAWDGIDLSGVSVLVVEDECDARELIRRVLSQCGADVVAVGGAMEALDTLRTRALHVIVSDIGMPEMDGFELIRRVRKLPAANGGRIPAIALTAFARSEDRTRALLAGYQMHIAKPVEPHELVATIASFAGRTTRIDGADAEVEG